MTDLDSDAQEQAELLTTPTQTAPGFPTISSNPYLSVYRPQDPFLPNWPVTGPTFLDNGACICAIQDVVDGERSTTAWRCRGNSTDSIYEGKSGVWFYATSQGGSSSNANDNSNPPDLTDAFVFPDGSTSLVRLDDLNPSPLSIFDQACTGVNETTFSTAFYRAAGEQEANQPPVDGAPCWRLGALPIEIVNASAWQQDRCGKGFFCSSPFPCMLQIALGAD